MSTPLINGTRHSWGSIKFNLLGRTLTGIVGIKYEDNQDKSNNYGAGNFPDHRGLGKYEAKASITLYAYEVQAIQETVGLNGRLQDIEPFDIVVNFLSPSDKIVNHTIRNCEFLSNKRDHKSGDSKLEVELDLIVSHIEWQ